ncbi:MAG TPA: coproporphyrinogen III oxidase, partial [Enteractinococcus sp.]
ASRVLDNISPAIGHEILDDDARLLEKIMLGVRLAEGLDTAVFEEYDPETAQRAKTEAELLATQGLIEPSALDRGKIVPTLRGRLLDDAITRRLAGF